MATQVKYGSDYYEYLDLIQKLCIKINLIQKDQVQLIYKNFNINACKEELDKELELIDEMLNEQDSDLSNYS